MNVKVFVCYHKKDVYRKVDGYIPIHVGKAISKVDLGFIGDDTGDNISALNPWYCELTALYWVWKNEKEANYIGLSHYRRSFDFKAKGQNRLRRIVHCCEDYFYEHAQLNENIIAQNDVILPEYQHFCIPIAVNLQKNHVKKDVEILRNIVGRLYPDFLDEYDSIFNGNVYAPCNMLIAKKSVFDGYCQWLFDILFAFSKEMSIPYDPYQPRVFGFYSERLMLVYMKHMKFKIGRVPLMLLDGEKNSNCLLQYVRRWASDIACLLYKKFD